MTVSMSATGVNADAMTTLRMIVIVPMMVIMPEVAKATDQEADVETVTGSAGLHAVPCLTIDRKRQWV